MARRGARGDGEVLYGVRAVREALLARRRVLRNLCIRKGRGGPGVAELRRLAEEAGVPVVELEASALTELAPGEAVTQGVLLRASALPGVALPDLAGPADQPRVLVALDGVEDPQNLGAIARVAEASGAAGLVLTERHAPPLGAAVSRASAGAIEWLPAARVTNLARSLEQLQGLGFWTYGAEPDGGTDLFELPERVISARRVVVLGAEGMGLRPNVLRRIDHRVQIPMHGRVDSLNVATAAAVVLFELARRTPPPG